MPQIPGGKHPIALLRGGLYTLVVENRELVLLVEDSDDDALMLRRAFKKVGIAMTLAHVKTGNQAIRYLRGDGDYGNRTVHPLPRFVLLDLGLPGKDGNEVLGWIR